MSKHVFRKFFGISILILVVMVSIYLFLHSSFFNIEKIYVTGLEKVSEDEIIRLSGLSTGKNIFAIGDEFCSRAIEIHPMVKNAKIVRHLPRKIEVQIEERKIWALIPYQDLLLCVDEEGVCIDKLNKFSLNNYPIITMDTLPERVNLGQAVQPDGTRMIKTVWDALSAESKKEISDFHYNSKSKQILIYTNSGTEVRFGDLDRLEEKTGFFDHVLKMEKDMDKNGKEVMEYIDFRFKGQPVVKTKV